MAPVEAEFAHGTSNTRPLALAGVQSGTIATLVVTISYFIYHTHRTPPALRTRKNTKHRREITTFALLTALSLALTIYHALSWRYASYANWAQEKAVKVPGSIFGGSYTSTNDDTISGKLGLNGWYLGRWMADTDLVAEIDAASIASPRGLWWTYQNYAGLLTWSIFAGIEGRHRNIPQYITLAFVALAQLASLSTSQNLFYILLLLTPVPLADGPPADASHNILTPHTVVLAIPALLGFVWLAFLPTLQHTSFWDSVFSAGYFIMPLLLACLAQPNVLQKAKRHVSVQHARKYYENIFRILAFASFGLHAFNSYKAVLDEAPPHRYLSHDYVWNMHREQGNTRFQQALTVFTRVIGVLSDNPVVSQVGWDVLLSVLSLCIWAGSHGIDVTAMLRCSGLSWSVPAVPNLGKGLSTAKSMKAKSQVGDVVEEIADCITVASPEKRARGRPRKHTAAIAKDHISSATSVSGSLRRSTRGRGVSQVSQVSDDSESDEDYIPSEATQNAVAEFDFDSEAGLAQETEAVALAWGLFSFGGLGAITAGVLGAETTAR